MPPPPPPLITHLPPPSYPPPLPPGALTVWCTVILATLKPFCSLQTVEAQVVIFKSGHVCVLYALSCLSACHDFSAILLLPCHCPCPQRLNSHLEPHHAEEAAATYWADLTSSASIYILNRIMLKQQQPTGLIHCPQQT